MSNTSFSPDLPGWPVSSYGEMGVQPVFENQEHLGPDPLIASDFPLSTQETSNNLWHADHLMWSKGGLAKPGEYHQYPQSWWAAGLVDDRQPCRKDGIPSPMSAFLASPAALGYDDFADGQISSASELATERALFMHHPMNTAAFPPFPGSPTSDPCDSPGTSHASSGGWDIAQDREDATFLSSAVNSPPQMHPQPFTPATYPHQLREREDENALPQLEMPDGSTRLSSNWLPVDPHAGYVIGPSPPCHSSDRHHLAAPLFQHNHIAFIPTRPPAWACDG